MRVSLLIMFLALVVGAVSVVPRAGQADSHPTASIDWTMADRYGLDENNDEIVDYFPETSSLPGLTGDIDPETFTVRLDGCDSFGDSAIVSYRWVVDGATFGPFASCLLTRQLAEGTHPVSLTVTDAVGEQGVLTKDVIVQDWLIVALGDSYGSGEGSPDEPIPFFVFSEIDEAQQALDGAQADLDDALADLLQAEADFTQTANAIAAAAALCGWFDTDGDDLYETFDLFAVDVLGCLDAAVDIGLAVSQDTINLLGGLFNDALAVAEAAVETAVAAKDLAQATFDEFASDLANLEESLKATWQDRRCHRSGRAGSAQAALEIEQMDPRTSVTFVHLACSGAEALIGFLEPYQGVDVELQNPPLACGDADDPGPCLPPQIAEAARLVGDREIDALYMSIGGNDANFAPIVQACIVLEPCQTPPATPDPAITGSVVAICTGLLNPITFLLVPACIGFLDDLVVEHGAGGQTAAEFLEEGLAELAPKEDGSGLYQRIDAKFAQVLPELTDDRIYISEYPNATQDDNGAYCPDIFPQNNLPGLSAVEAPFTDQTVTLGIDAMVELGAGEQSWNFIDNVYEAYAGHGYCADDHWIVRMDETFGSQGNHTGMVHPNPKGQAAYRDLIAPAIIEDLYVNGDIDSPRVPAQPPVADAGGPYTAVEGASIQLDGSGSSSPDGDAFDYLWSPTLFANGSTLSDETTAAPTLNATDNGSLSVTLTVADDDGETSDVTVVNVANVAPTVAAGADVTMAEGASLSRTGSFTDPSSVDTHTATVNYGDGTGAAALGVGPGRTFVLGHVYADDGTYTVQVCVTDDDSGTGCDSFGVTVTNVAPTAAAGGDQSVGEGAAVDVAAGFSDAGTLDTHTATIDWGDGTSAEAGVVSETPFGPPGSPSGASGNVAGSHVYADDGSYTVTICVIDDDGDSDCDDLAVQVSNAAPATEAGADQATTEGATFGLITAGFTDPGTLDTHTSTVDWGDGSAVESGMVSETPTGPPGSASGATGSVSATHAYGDNGAYTVTVCVTDDDGASHCDSATVTVANVAPAATIARLAEGAPFALTLAPVPVSTEFIDPGFLDTHTATIDWGDGSPGEAAGSVASAFSRSHVYMAPGFYTITITVTDDDGAPGVATGVIEIVDPLEALDRIVDDLLDLANDPDTNEMARGLILLAIADLEGNNGGASQNGAYTLLETGSPGAAVEKIEHALYQLAAAAVVDDDLELQYEPQVLVWAARSIAVDVVDQAGAIAVSKGARKSVAEARNLIAEGDALREEGNYPAAADTYQKAIGKVEKLLS